MMLQLVNFIAFQIGWFACVLGAAIAMPWIGVATALFVVAIHFFSVISKIKETILLLTITALGYAWDSFLVVKGFFQFQGNSFEALAPIWILAMWAIFATTLNSSLTWLQRRYLLSSFLGAILGPLAYYTASKLGAVTIVLVTDALLIQAIAWAMLMPLMLLLNSMLNQRSLQYKAVLKK